MKSILKFGIATVLALTPAAVFAATGDAIFFSISPTDPFAGVTGTTTTVPVNAAGTVPLYIWVTSNSESTAITPGPSQVTGGGSPLVSAAMALNATLTGTGAGTGLALTGAVYDTPVYTGGIARWSAVTTNPLITSGVSFSNFEANTASQDPNGTTYAPGTVTGLSGASNDSSPTRVAATVPGGLPFAWRVGTVNLNATANGNYSLALTPGSLGITKGPNTGGTGTTIDLAPGYTFGTANINVSIGPVGRNGDINGDGKVNAADIDLMSAKLLAGGLPYDVKYDYRSTAASPGPPPANAPDGIINQADKDRLIGSLIDINNVATSVGTHYGDADLNGTVNANDFVLLAGSLGQAAGWGGGDFTGDGIVNANDYVILTGNLGQSGGTGAITVVPEPTSLALCGIGLFGMLAVRVRGRKV